MPLFEWKPLFSVGIGSIDSQHQKLIGYMNQFYDAVQKGNAAEAKMCLGNLLRYTTTHFTEEEAMMQRAKFPGLEEHKGMHRQLLELAGKLAKTYETDPTTQNADRMASYLKTWLTNHIMGMDKKYTPSMQEHGLK